MTSDLSGFKRRLFRQNQYYRSLEQCSSSIPRVISAVLQSSHAHLGRSTSLLMAWLSLCRAQSITIHRNRRPPSTKMRLSPAGDNRIRRRLIYGVPCRAMPQTPPPTHTHWPQWPRNVSTAPRQPAVTALIKVAAAAVHDTKRPDMRLTDRKASERLSGLRSFTHCPQIKLIPKYSNSLDDFRDVNVMTSSSSSFFIDSHWQEQVITIR